MAHPRFMVHQPANLEEMLDLLGRHRTSVKVLAGGTDLLPRLRAGEPAVDHLVSVNRVAGLNRINYMDEDGLVLGAGARLSDVARHPEVRRHYPALAQACAALATPQVRNAATVAGNLAGADPAADTAPPLMAYRGTVVLVERGGRRQVKLEQFFQGPGQSVLEPMEVLEAIRVPAQPARSGSAFLRVSPQGPAGRAVASVAGFLALDLGGRMMGVRLALGGVAPTPLRCPEAEALLEGNEPHPELLGRAAAACVRAARPADDWRASANYRRAMVQVLAKRVLEQCLAQAQGGAQ